MKLFFGEFEANYKKYHFPYQVWLLKETIDDVEKIYQNGFLPVRSLPNIYYLSRSVRVDLAKFELSSENRRILKKTENFTPNFISLSDFNYTPQTQKFCKDYMVNKFGRESMGVAAVREIFKGNVYNHIFVWKENISQKEVGYAVCYNSANFIQYAHAFYDLNYAQQSLGAGMILEAVEFAKKSPKRYIYLGTCYEQSALYKTEFKGVEFFNGFRWSSNLEELKNLVKQTPQEYLLKNKKFLEEFYRGDLHSIINNYGVKADF